MSYLETAIEIAVKAHKGQIDKCGTPYILHPLHVMEQMETEEEKTIAVLHDVIEDSDFTARELREHGIPESIINTVTVLTKQSHESYAEYINRVSADPVAVKVKMADLRHNLDENRITGAEARGNTVHAEKYHAALEALEK